MTTFTIGITCRCGGDVSMFNAATYRADRGNWTATSLALVRCDNCAKHWEVRTHLTPITMNGRNG